MAFAGQRHSGYPNCALSIPSHIAGFWEKFLNSPSCPEQANELFLESFQIGSNANDADEGLRLILKGEKTATSSLLWQYEREKSPLPFVGSLSVVEDGRSNPACVVQTTWVKTIRFTDVDADFARDYAETEDGSIEAWYDEFEDYYVEVCEEMGRTLEEDTPLFCERFRVIIFRGE